MNHYLTQVCLRVKYHSTLQTSLPQQAGKTLYAEYLLLGIYLAQDLLYGLLISAGLDEALLGSMPIAAIALSPLYCLHPPQRCLADAAPRWDSLPEVCK